MPKNRNNQNGNEKWDKKPQNDPNNGMDGGGFLDFFGSGDPVQAAEKRVEKAKIALKEAQTQLSEAKAKTKAAQQPSPPPQHPSPPPQQPSGGFAFSSLWPFGQAAAPQPAAQANHPPPNQMGGKSRHTKRRHKK